MNPLVISPNGRRILHADGSPFFYLADTAWELFHRLTPGEITAYLDVRAEQRFTVIQAVILAEFDGLTEPNPQGDTPLHDNDPTKPNEAYFRAVDEALRAGAERGLVWGLLPTWGDKWNQRWGTGPEIFTPENARIYGRWLGARYREVPLIWILGGDRPIDEPRHLEILRAMAEGLAEGDGGTHLMTFHPNGGRSSAEWVHREDWLDFNMLQSGHESGRLNNQDMLRRDWDLTPAKPCLDGEPPYENHPDIALRREEPAPYFNDRIVRRAAYQAVFAGACGHTYGCHDIWQFLDAPREPVNRARTPWREAVHLPGANQMRHLRALVEQVPFERLQTWPQLASVLPSGEPVQSLLTKDGDCALVYFSTPGIRTLQMSALDGETAAATWFNPRTGGSQAADSLPCAGLVEIQPPATGDWVLILQVR